MLLTGTFPFLAPDKNLTKRNIVYEKLDFKAPGWHKVSYMGKDLVNRMLEKR